MQRALGIGYGRAARLIDFMAEDGIVGQYNGSQARDVLISLEDWEAPHRQRRRGRFSGRRRTAAAQPRPGSRTTRLAALSRNAVTRSAPKQTTNPNYDGAATSVAVDEDDTEEYEEEELDQDDAEEDYDEEEADETDADDSDFDADEEDEWEEVDDEEPSEDEEWEDETEEDIEEPAAPAPPPPVRVFGRVVRRVS